MAENNVNFTKLFFKTSETNDNFIDVYAVVNGEDIHIATHKKDKEETLKARSFLTKMSITLKIPFVNADIQEDKPYGLY